jgi:hypothetical protein
MLGVYPPRQLGGRSAHRRCDRRGPALLVVRDQPNVIGHHPPTGVEPARRRPSERPAAASSRAAIGHCFRCHMSARLGGGIKHRTMATRYEVVPGHWALTRNLRMAARVLMTWVASVRWSSTPGIVRRRRVRRARLGCNSLSRAVQAGAWTGSVTASVACRAAGPWPWLLSFLRGSVVGSGRIRPQPPSPTR